jgi:hypothetical protein
MPVVSTIGRNLADRQFNIFTILTMKALSAAFVFPHRYLLPSLALRKLLADPEARIARDVASQIAYHFLVMVFASAC